MAVAEEEIELTEEQKAYESEYNEAFFNEGEDDGKGGENSETEENDEVDQGHQEPEGEQGEGDGDPTGDEAGEEENQDGKGDGEDPEGDQPDNEHDETSEDVDDPEGEEQKSPTVKLKWNGEDVEVTEEELIALGQKGFDYTAKMQNVAKYRKDLEAAGITEETLDLLKRVQSGDKAAAVEYLNSLEVDPLDLIDVEVPENDRLTPRKEDEGIVISEQVKPLMEQIMGDPVLQSSMERAETHLPDAVINAMAQNADLLYAAVIEVQTGSFDQVMPQVQKRLATLSDLDREYVLNSPEGFASIYNEEKMRLGENAPAETDPVETPAAATPAVVKKKPNMAQVGIKKSTPSRHQEVIKDAFNDDDEYHKIMKRVRNQR